MVHIPLRTDLEFYKRNIELGLNLPHGVSARSRFLSRDDEIKLFDRAKALQTASDKLEVSGRGGSKRAIELQEARRALINQVVLCNAFLAVTIAKGYLGYGFSLMELVSETLFVFFNSARTETFDPHDREFKTYAKVAARNHLSNFVIAGKRSVYYPDHVLEEVRKVKQENLGTDGRPLTPERMKEAADRIFSRIIPKNRLKHLHQTLAFINNPDYPLLSDRVQIRVKEPLEILTDREDERERKLEAAKFKAAFARLQENDPQKAVILKEHISGKTLGEIGKQVGKSTATVRSRESQAKAIMKRDCLQSNLRFDDVPLPKEIPEFEKMAVEVRVADEPAKRPRAVRLLVKQDPAAFHRAQLELQEYYPNDAFMLQTRYPETGAIQRLTVLMRNIRSSRNWNGII